MKRLKDNSIYLSALSETPTVTQRQALIKTANREQILAIAEIVLNALQGNIKLSAEDIKGIKPYSNHLRKVGSSSRVKWTERKAAAVKAGKAISFILKRLLEKQ